MTVAFVQLWAGLVVPTLLVAKLHAPMHTAAAAADAGQTRGGAHDRGEARRDDGGSAGSPQQQQRGSPRKGGWLWAWACGVAQRGEAAVMCGCQLLMNGCGSPLLTAAAWWALLSLVWVSALLLELPQYALQWPGGVQGMP